ncbi:hypothetical protein ACFX4N_23700 [Priestia sp. YIM B13551]|uniref:hypothetical protein n=1 Tax=Priestia sp. YIM B13551 TaxID=3366306 RepID=UPI0036727E86
MADNKRSNEEQNQEQKKSSLLGSIARTGALVGGGALAYTNRTAIARGLSHLSGEVSLLGSRVLTKEGRLGNALSDTRVLLTGVSDALGDNPSILRTLRAGYDKDVQEKMRKDYEASIRNNIKKRQTHNNKPGQNRTELASRYYREFYKREMNGLNKFQYSATQSFRQNQFLKELGNHSEIKKHGGDKILNSLMDYYNKNAGIINQPANHIDDFIKHLEDGTYKHKVSFKDKTEKNAFQKQMLQTLDKYSETKKVHDTHEGIISQQAKAMETGSAYAFIKDAMETTSLIGKALEKKGFRAATLKDVEHLDEASKRKYGLIVDDVDNKLKDKSIDVTKELRKFLDEHRHNEDLKILLAKKGHSFDFSNIKLDKHLFIHHETGEVLDNRHLRDTAINAIDTFQDSVKTSFLNINPVDLTPWQAIRSGQAKEGLQVLSAGQVHGYVRNLGDQAFDDVTKATHNGAIRNPLKNSDHFYTGGNVFRFTEEKGLELIDENLYLAPSQFGAFSRMHKNMTNYSELETEDERGWLKKLFDLGHQEGESRLTTYKKAWNKLSDPMYGPNALRSLVYDLHTTNEGQENLIRDVYNVMRVGIDRNTKSLTREAGEVLAPHVNKVFDHIKVNGEAFDFSRLTDDDYLKDAALVFHKELKNGDTNLNMYRSTSRSVYNEGLTERDASKLYEDSATKELSRWTQKYIKDPEGFSASREAPIDKSLPHVFDFMVSSLGENEGLIPATEKLRRSFHQYALRALDDNLGDFEPSKIKNGVRNRTSVGYLIDAKNKGFLSDKDVKNAKDLELLTDLLSYDNIHDVNARTAEAKTFLDDIMHIKDGDVSFDERKLIFESGKVQLTGLGQELQEGILRAQPILGRAPEPSQPSLNGADFIIMRKSGLRQTAKETVSELNLKNLTDYGPIEDGWDLAINTEMYTRNAASSLFQAGKDVTQEMFAGRHRKSDSLENVTTSTAIMYGLAERLDNQFTNFGIGLSRQNLGSFQSIMTNQYLRRIVLPYAAYQQAVWFDGLTGDNISDSAADAYVNTHETLAQVKDMLGINKAMKPWAKVFQNAGFDQVKDWVGVEQLNFLTMGAFTDFRSADEVEDYYESGEDPIRKNRYWGIGSPSPWSGNGIEYYAPNWYRRIKSDYKFTDTMYGDESEYWANNWMPTLTHPFAPIKHFLTDPYHYEKKHEVDRPYAITGGFSEIQNIPIVGNLIDGTVGRILKPRIEHKGLEKAHEEYLASVNQYISEQYSTVEDGAYLSVAPGGGVTVLDMYGDQGTWNGIGRPEPVSGISGTGPTHGAEAGHVNYGNGIKARYKTGSDGSGGGLSFGGAGYVSDDEDSQDGYGSAPGNGTSFELTKQQLAMENWQLAQEGKGKKANALGYMQKLSGNMSTPEDLDDVMQLDSIANTLTDGFYSASELGGIYGFLTKTGIGYTESWRGTTLAPSTLMTSPSRSFWDLSLGGVGGPLSEIGRRYIPRDPNKNYYSPIRNTMPEWLPGIESYTDFLHGDPYTKIKQGEMRLPGKAYEKLYKLHPDGTGTGEFANYGVFDRFRILADVSPDSDQYKVAKHEVSLLRQAGGMSEDMEKEFDEITDQVHNMQDTMRWYDKKFTNAEIKKETVTVTKVLDGNTFMVQEYDTPIKLAGVKLTKKDNQDAIDWLSQFIKPGEKLKIGVADDPSQRYNKDTYNTLSAVVYANKNEEGRFWFESNKGQSLNAILANRTWNKPVQIKDKGTATQTAALYSNDMITVGKYMETLTHDILPKVPFVGILADKFLQVRTPIESYKRTQVYSSDWRPWTEPYEGWIKPMINTVASQNPLIAGAELAAIGHMFGKRTKVQGLGRVGGFLLGAGLASLRVFDEAVEPMIGADGVWLPKERVKEREINEYFDRLKYVKYRGLYEKARRLAESEEGVDVEQFFDEAAEKGKKNKGLKRFLTDKKRMLSLAKKTGYGDPEAVKSQISDLSSDIKDIEGSKEAFQAGKYSALAIQYRKEYEGTLYGMDGSASDRTALMRALTPKEREFIPRFLETTNSKDRQEILKYVPKDIKRILQGSWGLDVDKQEDIKSFFNHHFLPGQNWSGWNASVNLDDIKIKVMQKAGINPTNSGYWGKDQARAEKHGAQAIPVHSLSGKIDTSRLSEALQGAGLSDVDVRLTTSYGDGPGGVNTSINIMQDVKNEILDTINESALSIF